MSDLDPFDAWTVYRPCDAALTFGAKDIFDTADFPTEYGSPLYRRRRPERDAALVALCRAAGAVLAGKTHTTAFAYFDPAPTRNPRNPEHTPGGSSSGSAVAVATGMCTFALGSQTQGSILRPASFCGVVGFKPTYGFLPTEGMLPFAPTLDTAGLFTRTVAEMCRVGFSLRLASASPSRELVLCPRDPDPQMGAAIAHAVATLRKAGFTIHEAPLPIDLDAVHAAVRRINQHEGARTHAERYRQHGEAIGAKLAQLVEEGLRIPDPLYHEDLALLAGARAAMRAFPMILTPAAPGSAPRGLASTGDPRMNAPWTGLHGPAISVPMPVDGLPLGLQIAAPPGQDAALLATAQRIEAVLALQ